LTNSKSHLIFSVDYFISSFKKGTGIEDVLWKTESQKSILTFSDVNYQTHYNIR
jgi:hypothetical protein